MFSLLFAEGPAYPSENAQRALYQLTRGHYARHFWMWGLSVGVILPAVLLLIPLSIIALPALLLAGAGLYFYSYAYVMAPQELPNS